MLIFCWKYQDKGYFAFTIFYLVQKVNQELYVRSCLT